MLSGYMHQNFVQVISGSIIVTQKILFFAMSDNDYIMEKKESVKN